MNEAIWFRKIAPTINKDEGGQHIVTCGVAYLPHHAIWRAVKAIDVD